jgi:hypothetical protein
MIERRRASLGPALRRYTWLGGRAGEVLNHYHHLSSDTVTVQPGAMRRRRRYRSQRGTEGQEGRPEKASVEFQTGITKQFVGPSISILTKVKTNFICRLDDQTHDLRPSKPNIDDSPFQNSGLELSMHTTLLRIRLSPHVRISARPSE